MLGWIWAVGERMTSWGAGWGAGWGVEGRQGAGAWVMSWLIGVRKEGEWHGGGKWSVVWYGSGCANRLRYLRGRMQWIDRMEWRGALDVFEQLR